MAPYNPGFDVNVSKEKHIITSLDPKSKAFAAGLKNGQTLASIAEHPDDISQMIEVVVKENGQSKTIKYYPYKGELKMIPQFVLDQKNGNPNQVNAYPGLIKNLIVTL